MTNFKIHKEIDVELNQTPEYMIQNGTAEEVVWAAGKLSREIRLKDVPEFIEPFYEACSALRQRTGKEDTIDKFFNMGKKNKSILHLYRIPEEINEKI